MKSTTLLYHLRKDFPKSIASPGDFIGLQTGKLRKETKTIVLCLDFDNDVFKQIKNKNVDLILTHHPLIYGKRKDVLKYDEVKRKLVKTIDKLNIPVYSLHTNFDSGVDGMNDNLAKILELKNIRPLINDPMLHGGELKKPMDVLTFAKFVKQKFNLPEIYLINRGKKIIKSAAICGGAGSDSFKVAMKEGYDIYLSGDAPHHIRHDIASYSYNYIEVLHEVEQIFIEVMARRLKELDPSLKIIKINQPYPKFY